MKSDYIVYTDGSLFRLQRPTSYGYGGWAYVRYEPGINGWVSRYGGAGGTNIKRMETQAAIEALRDIPKESSVLLYSDARYLLKMMNKRINRNEYNNDLFGELDILCETRNVAWIWVKGHSGIEGNVLADRLARKGRLEFTEQVGRHDPHHFARA